MTNNKYVVHKLPPSVDKTILRKFAAFNAEAIRAIQADRMVLFAPTLLKRPEDWAADLKKPDVRHWILVAPDPHTGIFSLEEGQWVGMYVLQGPLPNETTSYYFEDDDDEDEQATEGSRWIGRRLYIQEAHRNRDAFLALDPVERSAVQNTGCARNARIRFTARAGSSTSGFQTAAENVRSVKQVYLADMLQADGMMDHISPSCRNLGSLLEAKTVLFEKIVATA